MIKIVVLGAMGQLGRSIQARADQSQEYDMIPITHQQVDVTNIQQIRLALQSYRPDVVINCVAYSNVDKSEKDISYSRGINAVGGENVAQACEEIGCALIYLSTDYVFNGAKKTPYVETDVPSPIQVYGSTKWEGEMLASKVCSRLWVVRISWLYGPYGSNFLRTILGKCSLQDPIAVVNDQTGSPTNSLELADTLLRLPQTAPYGLYHLSGVGACSWFDFACRIVDLYSVNCKISPCSTNEYPVVARRPVYSYLDNSRYRQESGRDLMHWEESLAIFSRQYSLEMLLTQ